MTVSLSLGSEGLDRKLRSVGKILSWAEPGWWGWYNEFVIEGLWNPRPRL